LKKATTKMDVAIIRETNRVVRGIEIIPTHSKKASTESVIIASHTALIVVAESERLRI